MLLKDATKDSEIPETETVSVAKVGANDVMVIESARPISDEAAHRIKAYMERVWPDQKCIVLGEDLKLKIAREIKDAIVPGDKMRCSVPFLQQIHDEGTRLVRVVKITEEQDGTKTLVMEVSD